MAGLKEVGNALEKAMGTGGFVYINPDTQKLIDGIVVSGGSDKIVKAKFQSNGKDAFIRVSKPTTGIAGGMTFYYWADGKAIEPKVTIEEDGTYLIRDEEYDKDFYNPYASDWMREKITKCAIYAGIAIAVLVIAIIKRKRRK